MRFYYLFTLIADLTPVKSGGLPNPNTGDWQIQNILSFVFGIIGALAFLMVVISGLRYVLSSGDPAKVEKAKNALIYALIGLLVALVAQAIVSFAIGEIE